MANKEQAKDMVQAILELKSPGYYTKNSLIEEVKRNIDFPKLRKQGLENIFQELINAQVVYLDKGKCYLNNP
jgi:hypothetical protein